MQNLFWKDKKGKMTNLVDAPFRSEEALETYICETPELLSDLFILKRQVRSSSRHDVPDIVGIDKDGNVLIVEIKNTQVAEDIVPQLLRYAFWADSNPDSIKALWLECSEKPEGLEPSWENLSVKIRVIAPSFRPTVLRLVNKINYEVELLELRRFTFGSEEFVLLNKLESEAPPSGRMTVGREVYDKTYYLKHRNKSSVPLFLKTVAAVERLVKKQGWTLERKFNQGYAGFKYGFPNVFGVTWLGSKSFGLFFKMPKETADQVRISGIEPLRYEQEWNQVLYKVEGDDFDVERLLPLFKASYKYITGT